jgi:UTP--glucose-1-phosphate uridylyltransferase
MPEKVTTAVIAAAGQGTRMWPASKVFPKELFPLGKIPVIVHLIWEFLDAGIEKIVIVAGEHNREYIAALLDPGNPPPAKLERDPIVQRFQRTLQQSIELIEQPADANYGNGTPLHLAARKFGMQPYVYAFGDDIIIGENATRSLLAIYECTGCPVMGAQEVAPARKSSFGILECKPENGIPYITRLLEKPRPEETPSNLATFGRYLVTTSVLEMLGRARPGKDGEIWFIDAVMAHMEAGGRACASTLQSGVWYTVGDPKSYADAVEAATEEQLRNG